MNILESKRLVYNKSLILSHVEILKYFELKRKIMKLTVKVDYDKDQELEV